MKKIFTVCLLAISLLGFAQEKSPLACATKMFSLPGKEYMHKLVPAKGYSIYGVELRGTQDMTLKTDRAFTGNRYYYLYGKAPQKEGEYTYTVILKDSLGKECPVPVQLTVSSHLQSATPPMSWISWNWFAEDISHEKIIDVAKGMQQKGLIDAGYNHIVIDDCWAENDSVKARLTYNKTKFPQGITGLVADLKKINHNAYLGIYSDAGSLTCTDYQPGSYGYEKEHLRLFDSWGVDMLKYDFCNSEGPAYESYRAMGDAISELNKERAKDGRPTFLLNICEWGSNKPWLWGAEAGGCCWRATPDGREAWIGSKGLPGVLGCVDHVRDLWMYAGVNRYNDLDMLCVGLHGIGGPSNYIPGHDQNGGTVPALTEEQSRSQMNLWCMFASPLSLSCDFREHPQPESNKDIKTLPEPLITNDDIAILTNKELIAINQDALGQQAEYLSELSTDTERFAAKGYGVFVKDLSGGRKAVAVVNRSNKVLKSIDLPLDKMYMRERAYIYHNVWTGENKNTEYILATGDFRPFETKVFILTAKK